MKKHLAILFLFGGSLFAETSVEAETIPAAVEAEDATPAVIVPEDAASADEASGDEPATSIPKPDDVSSVSKEVVSVKASEGEDIEAETKEVVEPKPAETAVETPPVQRSHQPINTPPVFRHSTGLEESSSASFDTVYNTVIRRRLEVGFRTVSHDLDVDGEIVGERRESTVRDADGMAIGSRVSYDGTYFGSINELQLYDEDVQKLFIQYAVIPYAGFGVTWDEMDIATKDGPGENNTDGDINVDTDMLYLFVRYPFQIPDTKFHITPFVEFGKADHSVGFDATTLGGWNERNSVTLSDDSGTYYAYGLEVTFNDRFSAHVIWRRSELTTTGELNNIDGRAPTPIEMRLDHDSFGFGAKFIF